MSRRTQENIVAGVMLGIFIGIIVMSLDYGPRARMIPLPLASFGVILMLIQLVWQNLRSTDDLQMDMLHMLTKRAEQQSTATAEEAGGQRKSSWRGEVAALGIVASLVALILLIGPIPSVFIFTGAYFLLSGHYSWFRGLVYTSAFTAAMYLLFVVALEVQLYHGLLAPLVERFR
ncbi:MAG TPA: tripartite tricarboxylate transporter TctB family protein [Burkholderiales bacterium]|nr:tripartite tricarboxylate transporter TctB family protein [Burkholderiales bacterium]